MSTASLIVLAHRPAWPTAPARPAVSRRSRRKCTPILKSTTTRASSSSSAGATDDCRDDRVSDDGVSRGGPGPLSAVIVGGGIGGLAAAVALRRVGIDAHVYERALELRSNVGTGIALWPNGVNALRTIGPDVAQEVASRGCDITGMRMGIVDEEEQQEQEQQGQGEGEEEGGPTLGSRIKDKLAKAAMGLVGSAFPRVMRMQHGAGLVCIRWADVQAALASFLPQSCVHLDAAIDGLELIQYADGTEKVRCSFVRRTSEPPPPPVLADIVIGADGINSAVRAAVVGDGPPRDNGRVIWRGVVKAADATRAMTTMKAAAAAVGVGAGGRGDEGSSSENGGGGFPEFCPAGATALKASKDSSVGRTVCFMDVGGGNLYWAAGCLDEGIVDAAPEDSSSSDKARARASCAATFASYPDVLACLEATTSGSGEAEDAALYTSRVLDRPPLTPADAAGWTGPITLIGDAAHPVIPSFGQGANLALEDAADLAATLAEVYTAPGASATTSTSAPSIAATLRGWEQRRLERTAQAQIASFLSGSKSYGEEKFAEAVAASGISSEDLDAHKERFPDANATQGYLIGWKPTVAGGEELSKLAPAAAMSLARRTANSTRNDDQGGRMDDDVNARPATPAPAPAKSSSSTSSRRDVLSLMIAGGGLSLFSSSKPFSSSGAAHAAEVKAEAKATVSTSTAGTLYESDGFRMTLPAGWTAVEIPGVSQSSTAIYFGAAGSSGSSGSSGSTAAPVATVLREPTGTMGAQGMTSLYSSPEDFGTRVAGTRRGVLETTREGGGNAGGVYIAEGKNTTAGGGTAAGAPWFELIAVGCRSSETARKFNLMQTVRVVSINAPVGAPHGPEVEEGLRAMLNSFELTAGKTCGSPP